MRCAVVGSGVSGMTAALLLARQGHEVTLLEAGPRTAPLLRGFTRQGLRFDTGFHYGGGLHEGGILRRWLQALNVWQHLPPVSLRHEDIFHFDGEPERRLPAGMDDLPAVLDAQFPGHGPALTQWLAECDQVLAHSPYTNAAITENTVHWRGQSRALSHMLPPEFPPALQGLLAARCLLYGVPPSLAAWEDYALVAGPYFQSCGSWQGGGTALAQAFTHELAQCAVTVRCRATVTGLEAVPGEGLRGVHLQGGERLPCEQVFFTGHPGQLQSLLPPGLLRPAWFNRIHQMPETCPACILFAETDALPPSYSCYSLPQPQAGMQTGLDTLLTPLGSACPSLYLSCGPDDADSKGRCALMVMAFLQPEDLPAEDAGPVYAAFKERVTAQMVTLAEQRCPELKGHWRVLDAATPHSLRHWAHGSSGSLYGFRHDTETLPLLPVTRVPGLFLAGQNILLPGVLGVLVSAALAVGFAHGHDAALAEFRTCP